MASGHIVLIEHGPTAAERNLNSVLQDGFDCRLVRWPQLDRDFGVSAKADLVIPVALCRQSVLTTWKRRDRSQPRIPTLIVLAKNADEESLLLASQSGDDFLLWPTLASELLARVSRLIGCSKERSAAERNLLEEFGLLGLVGRTRRFVRVLRMVPKVATSSSSVLVTGETGTGKELLARAVHHLSPRKDFPFIPVDCGALPDHLFENELFGHVPGAFTDARAEQKGLAAMADRGTLFLDEVDSLTFRAQAKLLRFLQEGTYKRLGESRFSKTDVRVIAASNQDLRASVEKGEFRSDLFYRLSVIHLPLPPLRKRREDIRLLTAHYLGTLRPADEPVKTITKSAIRKL